MKSSGTNFLFLIIIKVSVEKSNNNVIKATIYTIV